MTRTFIPFALITLLMAIPIAADAADLDGRAFEVEMLPEGADQPISNTLTFRSGTFLSAVCVQHDFPQSDYSVTRDGDTLRFRVNAESYSKGNMDWEGTIRDGQLEARAVWHRPDRDEPVRFSIRGSQK